MRWTSWYPACVGERRTSSWFALWPVQIGNDVRWLEKVAVEWEFCVYFYLGRKSRGWIMRRFLDNKEEAEGCE